MAIHYKKVGGLHFIRIGRVNLSFSKSRKSLSTLDRLTRDAVHASWDRKVSHFEDSCNRALNPFSMIALILALVVWTVALINSPLTQITY